MCRGPWGDCAQEIRVIHLCLNIVFLCVYEHVCALEACASMFGVCTSKHLNQHVNKSGHMCSSQSPLRVIGIGVGAHECCSGDGRPAGSDFSLHGGPI